jgi:PAS domain S-box-containing protein
MKAFNKIAFLDQTFENSLDAIIFTDEKGYIAEANKAYMELIGCKKDEIIGKHTSEFSPMKEGTYKCTAGELIQIDKKFSEQLRATMKTYVETGTLQNIMGYQLRKDGKIVPVEDSMVFLVGDDGERIGGVAVIRDNTERIKAEIELKQTKDFLENIFMTSVDGVMIADSEGKIAAVNKAVEKIFDCSSDQLVGKHTTEIEFHEDEHQISGKELMHRLLSEDTVSGVERTWKKLDGTAVVVEMNIALLKDTEGNMTGSVTSIRDITDRKQAEEALKQSEEKYYNLIEHANDAIISINREGIIIGFNKSAEELFGYSREEMIGKSSYLFTSQQHKEKQKRLLQQFAEDGTKLYLDKNTQEGKGLRKDGKEIDIEFSYYILDIHGEFIATSIVRDITERKEAERKLIDYQKNLRSLTSKITLTEEQERRRFAEFLHDEIGQQLFATRLQLELLKGSLSSAKNRKTLDNAINDIKNVMANSRSLTFELSSPILHELGFEKALEWLVEQAHKKYDIRVTLKNDNQEKPLDDDAKIFLYQAVRELLTNVAKHAQTKNASVSVKKDNSNIRICVKDNGVGFNTSNKHSFDAEILGFGLFRISERVEQLGGQLEIQSQPNLGTQVTLVVPLGGNFEEQGT